VPPANALIGTVNPDEPVARRLLPVQPRTMVEQAAEAVVAAASRGTFLPGDRLVEAEIARELGISRVPVREALRLLESQGIVVSTPYKGMRLMEVTNRKVAEIKRVRAALEAQAIREFCAARVDPALLGRARTAARAYAAALAEGDRAATVAADVTLHGTICLASGNATLYWVWGGLARQLSVVWGLGQGVRASDRVLAEHERLLDALAAHDAAAAEAELDSHLGWHDSFDFEGAITARNAARR
jgi:DNA-binding GntR family transcriptional regulator